MIRLTGSSKIVCITGGPLERRN
uniref:Uncharacterized protein n=1 Tax=Anguilla anguilla TaxID=7936 RepID=A0A0E9VHZ9_ANGAN